MSAPACLNCIALASDQAITEDRLRRAEAKLDLILTTWPWIAIELSILAMKKEGERP